MKDLTIRNALLLPAIVVLVFPGLEFPAQSAAHSPSDRSPATSITLGYGGLRFLDEDLHHTYGFLPLFWFRLARQIDERGELFCGLQYSRGTGHPFYDTPDFRLNAESILEIVPLDIGLRVNAMSDPRYRFYFGLILRTTWVREELPFGGFYDGGSNRRDTGWGWGPLFSGGPEVRPLGRRHAFGVEVTAGPQDVMLAGRHGDREFDFSDIGIRGYISILFGSNRRER